MKSSGWSSPDTSVSDRAASRGIWACSAGVVAALALAPVAAAHVIVSPGRIAPGAEAQLFFSVADEEKVAITRVAIGVPPDFTIGSGELAAGWAVHRNSKTVMWDGNRLAPGEFANFGVYVEAPPREERAVFNVLVSLSDGTTLTYHPAVEVMRPGPTRDGTGRTLATAALAVGAAGLLLGLGAGFLALWLWLRPRPPDAF